MIFFNLLWLHRAVGLEKLLWTSNLTNKLLTSEGTLGKLPTCKIIFVSKDDVNRSTFSSLSASPSLSSLLALSFFAALGFLFCGSVSRQRNSRRLQNAAVQVRERHASTRPCIRKGTAMHNKYTSLPPRHDWWDDKKHWDDATTVRRSDHGCSSSDLWDFPPRFFLFNGLNISWQLDVHHR